MHKRIKVIPKKELKSIQQRSPDLIEKEVMIGLYQKIRQSKKNGK
jgi:hypothetical protein